MAGQVASGQNQTQKSYYTEGKTTNGSLGEIQRFCLNIQEWIQESQIQMELNLGWGFKDKYTREQKEDQEKQESSAERDWGPSYTGQRKG